MARELWAREPKAGNFFVKALVGEFPKETSVLLRVTPTLLHPLLPMIERQSDLSEPFASPPRRHDVATRPRVPAHV